jgi:prepilin-type N-terminal cleavage/methylation domain-containing protein
MKQARHHAAGGFTLIEILLASVIAALILAAIYGVFQRAIQMRDSDTQRIHDSRLRVRAADVIRNDLRNAYISGGVFASIMQGDTAGTDGPNSDFPGYLKFTTTTAKDTDDELYGDVEQVEYYIVRDPNAGAGGGGNLVRAVTRDLLDEDQSGTQVQAQEQQIMPGVESFAVSFYDGSNWQSSWSFNTADSASTSSTGSAITSGSSGGSTGATETLPEAIRVDIQHAPPTTGGAAPAPVEVLVPWTTQPFTSPTPSPSASSI